MKPEVYEALVPIVASVAIEVHRRYRYVLDREDVEHYAWEWALTRKGKVRDYLKEEDEDGLTKAMTNFVKKQCAKEKAQAEGYRVDDLFYYSKGMLEEILPNLFDDEAWLEPPPIEDGGSRKHDPAVGGNYLASLADVARAFDQLSEEDQKLLRYMYDVGLKQREIGDLYGISQPTVSERYERALKRLLELLGGPYPETDEPDWPRPSKRASRKHMSNAAMAATIRRDYSG